jgi:hypothetical protein
MKRLLNTRLGRAFVNRFYGTRLWNILRNLAIALGLKKTPIMRTERGPRQEHDLAQSRVIASFEAETTQMATGDKQP